MNHRRSDVRAAVFARRRSQGHLRTVTATVGFAGVVTAGLVAAILPGSAHASATSGTASTPAPAAPGQQQPRRQCHHRHIGDSRRPAPSPPSPSPPAGQRARRGDHRPGCPGAHSGRDHRAAAERVRWFLTWPQPTGSGSARSPASPVARPARPGPVRRES